jgi:hypothetical protein
MAIVMLTNDLFTGRVPPGTSAALGARCWDIDLTARKETRSVTWQSAMVDHLTGAGGSRGNCDPGPCAAHFEGGQQMEFPIAPYEGAGPIKFGMTRPQVRAILNEDYCEFRRGESSNLSDFFTSIAVFVYYNDSGVVEFIEFTDPAKPIYEKRNLLKYSYSESLKFFSRFDDNVELDSAGLTSYELGIAVYAPHCGEEPDGIVETIGVFEKGYYDQTASV